MFRSFPAIALAAALAGCAGASTTPAPYAAPQGSLPLVREHAAAHCPAYGKGSGILADGDFHQAVDPGGSYLTFNKGQKFAPLWSVTALDINFVGTGFWNFDHLCSVDLDGESAVGGIRHRAFSTKKGAGYTLTFLMSGNSFCGSTKKKMKVSVGNQSVDFLWNTSNGHSVQYGFVASRRLKFTAVGTTSTLSFTSLDNAGSGCGPVIGAVAVASD